MIQDALNNYDEQDIQLGMDTYYIEMNDQLFSTYGGILGIRMRTKRIGFTLDAIGRKELKDQEIIIDYTLDEEKYIKLKDALSQLSHKHAISADF